MKFAIIAVGLALLGLCSCNPSAKKDVSVSVETGAGKKLVMDVSPPAATPAPESVTLASGESVPCVSVAALDVKPETHAGQLAIMGKVEAVYGERGAFTVVDCAKMTGCADDCCSKTAIPMSVPTTGYIGELPTVGDELIVVGTLTPGETGYSFEVVEVRRGEETIITKKLDQSGATKSA
jgi:hypothetical protein